MADNPLKLPKPFTISDSFFKKIEQNEKSYNELVKNEISFKYAIDSKNKESYNLETSFLDSDFSSSGEEKEKADYSASPYRTKTYKSITEKDKLLNEYLKLRYGNVETFFNLTDSLKENKVYNPTTDYQVEVGVISKDYYYKSDFISAQEVVLENASGICTIDYLRVDGRADRMIASLQEDLVPSSQEDVRQAAFGGIANAYGERILVWNLLKGGWSSFYMSRLIRFIRDDTTGLE